jgi:hypothetical protein
MQHWIIYKFVHARYLLAGLILFAPILAPALTPIYAIPQVQERFDRISDSQPSAVAIHAFGFRYTDLANPVGSVAFEFCSNSPIVGDACVAPTGLDTSAAGILSQGGEVGFAINGSVTTANKLVIGRTPSVPSAPNAVSQYQFQNVTNPSVEGSHYVRVQTFSSVDATGAALEDGGVVFSINEMFDVSAEVPPYLKFCTSVTIVNFDCASATSFFIDFGEFSRSQPRSASSEMVVATNAGLGFTISLAGTTLTSGNNTIPIMPVAAASTPGNSQFGLNLRANSNPGIGADPIGPGVANATSQYGTPNLFRFTQGDSIVTSTGTTDNRKFTVSYIANINAAQPGGVYSTTISFIALANF